VPEEKLPLELECVVILLLGRRRYPAVEGVDRAFDVPIPIGLGKSFSDLIRFFSRPIWFCEPSSASRKMGCRIRPLQYLERRLPPSEVLWHFCGETRSPGRNAANVRHEVGNVGVVKSWVPHLTSFPAVAAVLFAAIYHARTRAHDDQRYVIQGKPPDTPPEVRS